MSGANGGTRHTKWRKTCVGCGKSVAVTWDQRTGDPYYVRHNTSPGVLCALAKRKTTREGLT